MKRKGMSRSRVAGCAAMLALAGCTAGGSEISRSNIYADVKDLAADSNLVVRATALSSERGSGSGSTGRITSFEISACPAVGGSVGTDRVTAQQPVADVCHPGDVVLVRTFSGDPVDAFDSGATYLLFLTETGLPDDPDNLYFVTGAVVGAFKQASDGGYARVVKEIPDSVPATVTDADVA